MSNVNTKHKYHVILNALAEGEEIQYLLHPSSSYWKTLPAECFLRAMVNGELGSPELYRVKPKTININGYEVPEPVRTKPNKGTHYYYYLSDLTSCAFCKRIYWNDDPNDNYYLESGLVHLNEEAAIQHAKALLSFTSGKEN